MKPLTLVMILAVVGSVARRRLVLRVVLNALAILHRSVIGLAVKPAVVLSTSIHLHIGSRNQPIKR